MILSFDIGTTNIKALLYEEGQVKKRYEVPVVTDNHTQDVEAILSSVLEIIADAEVNRLVFSTAMHTLILLDEAMNVMSPMYLWSSNLGYVEEEDYYNRTGVPQHSMTPYYKLRKLKGYTKVSDLKGYLMYKLTGQWVSDYSSAGSSGMFNIHKMDWDVEILKTVNLTKTEVPILKPIDTIIESNDFTIILGATDGVMANYGIQSQLNDLVVSIGTSVAVRKLVPSMDLTTKGFCYSAGNNYLIGNASNNGGNLFSTLGISFESMIDYLYLPLTDCFVLPYVFGERGPWYKESLAFEVLKGEPATKKDKVQSLILGMFSNVELMIEALNFDDDVLYVTGGFLRDQRILELFASYLNKTVMYVLNEDAVCRGNLFLIQDFVEPLHYNKIEPKYNTELLAYKKTSKSLIKSKVLDVD